MPVRSDDKDERFVYAIMRGILLLVAVAYVVFLFNKQPCNSIDKEFLSCNVTGSWGDWVGSIIFIGGLVWLSGIFKGLRGLSDSPKFNSMNWVFFVVMAAGIGLVLIA